MESNIEIQQERDINSSMPIVLQPLAKSERIQELDVIRGFALIGIFFMNVEFFNRSMGELGLGMPVGLTGANWFASWFVAYFIAGKFWTIFSLLFGMGFAVMLTRAEESGRGFVRPYLRRIAALAVFGALHHILIWPGDILFSYAVSAGGLMVILFGTWRWILLSLVLLIGLGFIPDMEPAWAFAGSLAFFGAIAIFMRNERLFKFGQLRLPLFSSIYCVMGFLLALGMVSSWFIPQMKEAKIPLGIATPVTFLIAFLSAKFHQPTLARSWRIGATIYLSIFSAMTIADAIDYFKPVPAIASASTPTATTTATAATSPTIISKVANNAPSKETKKEGSKKIDKTEAEKATDKKAERAKRLKERQEKIQTEIKVLTQGSYTQAVALRAKDFAERAAGQANFAIIVISMFLIGVWFVRSGVIANVSANLSLFRKMAFFGLPMGIGLGLLGSAISVRHVLGQDKDGFQLAAGLLEIGNLPASLGYASMVILMLHSASNLAKIRVLAPFGRMALTNYLSQSVIASMFFYGYGLGNWGLGRAMQLVFVAGVVVVQIKFSHWWLARFNFGPVEWLWRAITYWTLPPLRVTQKT